ncbi:hypothetical protein VTO42DRAFT_1269 [Malbranchea cinnamomea]
MVDVLSLSALPPRPPTPPRSSFQSASFKNEPNVLSAVRPGPLPSPPDLSPHPHSDVRKKVNFSPLPSYIKPLDLSDSSARPRSSLRNLRPSNECKPAKSILKSQAYPCPSKEELPAMLESITQQLSGASHASRSDAYMQLVGSLTAYRAVPEPALLCEKMELFAQFIRRDISQFPDASDAPAVSLVQHALKLLSMFAWHVKLSPHIPDEFKAFFLDQAIVSLQKASLPKSILMGYMSALSVITFPPKLLVNGKVIQLLSALKDLSTRVRHKNVTCLRLAIYEKLLLQTKSLFAAQANFWIDNLITALLHDMADIRIKAVAFGFQVAVTVGPNNAISKAIQDTLDAAAENQPKFGDKLADRLISMISPRESGVHVPQIWSVVILLLRRSRWSIEHWNFLKQWLLVIQKCFNCSDSAVKSQALIAWDRFVYAIQPSESTTSKGTIKLLFRPILSQLERKRNDRSSALLNQSFSSYYHLLYYAFRPSISEERIDLFWKEYVVRFFSEALVSTSASHDKACGILAAMFWNSHPEIWPEGKPIDSGKLSPSDLPRLDFKWVRSRLSTILPVFEILFKTAPWPESSLSESPVGTAWVSLSKCLAEASSKEIQPSQESMNAVAKILEMLQKVWKDAPRSLNTNGDADSDAFLTRFHFISTTIISTIGPMPFTDKLILKTSNETFQTATPTHRHPPNSGRSRSPIVHLLDLILHFPRFLPNATYCSLVRDIISVSLKGRASRGARLEILCQFADSLSEIVERPSDSSYPYAQLTWKIISELATGYLSSTARPQTPVRDRDSPKSRDYENAKNIILIGTKFSDLSLEWTQLLRSLATAIHADRANAALNAILEDVSDSVCRQSAMCLPYSIAILDLAVVPSDAAHSTKPFRPLNKIPGGKPLQEAVPLEKTMALADRALEETYTRLPDVGTGDMIGLFEGLSRFTSRCPSTFYPTLLEKCQAGLSVWLADSDDKITIKSIGDKSVLQAIQSLLSKVAGMLESCESTDSSLLEKLTTLVASGFESRHKSTTNTFIRVWKVTFGLQENLTYPVSVEKALRKLQPHITIPLPNFPNRSDSEAACTPPSFLASQEDGLDLEASPDGTSWHSRQRKTTTSLSAFVDARASTHKNHMPVSNTPGGRGISTPKPRPRHDHSQVKFVAVESSPAGPPETQALTDHQREVRERQRIESSRLFSDFQSTSATPGRSKPSSRTIRTLAQAQDNHTGTPTLPSTAAANDDELPLSSPTPGSKVQCAEVTQLGVESSLTSLLEWNSSDVEPPSSPPQADVKTHQATSRPVPHSRMTAEAEGVVNTVNSDADNNRPHVVSTYDRMQFQTPPSKLKRKNGPNTGDEDSYPVYSRTKRKRTEIFHAQEANSAPPAGILARKGEEGDVPPSSPDDQAVAEDHQDGVDVIHDSFSDELEQQIASQLEQDLELAMDLALESDTTAKPAVRQGKRKRGANGREKKVATKKTSVFDVESAHSNRLSKSPISDQCASHNADGAAPKRAGSRRSARSISPKQGKGSGVAPPKPALARRRSLRLRGEPASESVDEKGLEDSHRPARNDEDGNLAAAAATTDEGMVRADSRLKDSRLVDGEATAGNAPPSQSSEAENGEKSLTSPSAILSSLRNVLDSLKNVSFGKSTLRELDDLMFDIKMEAHNAMRRHSS